MSDEPEDGAGYGITPMGEAYLRDQLMRDYGLTLEEFRALSLEQVTALLRGQRN